ncbi:MAG: response regulator [Desulfobacterales bacterium]|nr:response regulator [Desulfobacterales bacterium]
MARILIIDDDDQVRKMLRLSLNAAGFDVVEAQDGKAAMKLFHQDPPVDLVITDLITPQKEGIETMIEFRRDFPKVPIIAISGGGLIDPDDYLVLADKLGAQITLEKPFSRKDIIDAVNELITSEGNSSER